MAYTEIDNPEIYFQCKTYTGDGNDNRAITFDGSEDMQPNFLWFKNRGATAWHNIYDSVRGANKAIASNANNGEESRSDTLDSFDSDGFTVGNDTSQSPNGLNTNASTNTYVSWAWKAGTTSGIAGSADITPNAYSFNQTAGFSIVTYNGTDVNGNTVLHGLGAVPYFMIVKRRVSNGYDWIVYHKDDVAGLYLNTTSNNNDSSSTNIWFHGQTPTSTQFHIGTDGRIGDNVSTGAFVAYLWSEVQGYSKFGQYEGNNSANGAFVYTGFRPAFVLIKDIDATNNWGIVDNKRGSINEISAMLNPNSNGTEGANNEVDFLSNGFKWRSNDGNSNASDTYIYMAFAESPFVNSNGVPTNAR